jgi:hypothetical protein
MVYDRKTTGGAHMDVLSPTGLAEQTVKRLAPRRGNLTGCRIGILDNSKPNADVLLERVAEHLAQCLGATEIRRWRKLGASRPAGDHDEIAAAVDVLLTGSAD